MSGKTIEILERVILKINSYFLQGDSGGPLVIDRHQVGINSAAAGCADP